MMIVIVAFPYWLLSVQQRNDCYCILHST